MDFSKWLYAHYIKPYLDDCFPEEYDQYLDLLYNELPPGLRADCAKAQEFWATRAFFLGLRTGVGLGPQLDG